MYSNGGGEHGVFLLDGIVAHVDILSRGNRGKIQFSMIHRCAAISRIREALKHFLYTEILDAMATGKATESLGVNCYEWEGAKCSLTLSIKWENSVRDDYSHRPHSAPTIEI